MLSSTDIHFHGWITGNFHQGYQFRNHGDPFPFSGGGKTDPINMGGIAYLATGLATSVPDPELLSQLMLRGSRFTFQVNMDFNLITMRCLSENLEETLDIFLVDE